LIVGRFMYHCHVLDHEDKGMMAMIEVYDPKTASPKGVAFRLVDQSGRTFTQADLASKPTLMFFGYDYCPDVCPVQLARMTLWLKALGPAANRLNLVYVTVDPERDTPAALKAYLSRFDPRIRGLTGTRSAIAKIAGKLGVYYKKAPMAGGGYSVDHSAETYVLDAHRNLIGRINIDEPDATLLPKLRRLLAQ
jgi:protein SCO1/2